MQSIYVDIYTKVTEYYIEAITVGNCNFNFTYDYEDIS